MVYVLSRQVVYVSDLSLYTRHCHPPPCTSVQCSSSSPGVWCHRQKQATMQKNAADTLEVNARPLPAQLGVSLHSDSHPCHNLHVAHASWLIAAWGSGGAGRPDTHRVQRCPQCPAGAWCSVLLLPPKWCLSIQMAPTAQTAHCCGAHLHPALTQREQSHNSALLSSKQCICCMLQPHTTQNISGVSKYSWSQGRIWHPVQQEQLQCPGLATLPVRGCLLLVTSHMSAMMHLTLTDFLPISTPAPTGRSWCGSTIL